MTYHKAGHPWRTGALRPVRRVAVAEAPEVPERGIAQAARLTAVYGFIVRYKSEHDGVAPTLREIAEECDISSTSVADFCLRLLEREGKIRIMGVASARSIHVVGGRWLAPGEEL